VVLALGVLPLAHCSLGGVAATEGVGSVADAEAEVVRGSHGLGEQVGGLVLAAGAAVEELLLTLPQQIVPVAWSAAPAAEVVVEVKMVASRAVLNFGVLVVGAADFVEEVTASLEEAR